MKVDYLYYSPPEEIRWNHAIPKRLLPFYSQSYDLTGICGWIQLCGSSGDARMASCNATVAHGAIAGNLLLFNPPPIGNYCIQLGTPDWGWLGTLLGQKNPS